MDKSRVIVEFDSLVTQYYHSQDDLTMKNEIERRLRSFEAHSDGRKMLLEILVDSSSQLTKIWCFSEISKIIQYRWKELDEHEKKFLNDDINQLCMILYEKKISDEAQCDFTSSIDYMYSKVLISSAEIVVASWPDRTVEFHDAIIRYLTSNQTIRFAINKLEAFLDFISCNDLGFVSWMNPSLMQQYIQFHNSIIKKILEIINVYIIESPPILDTLSLPMSNISSDENTITFSSPHLSRESPWKKSISAGNSPLVVSPTPHDDFQPPSLVRSLSHSGSPSFQNSFLNTSQSEIQSDVSQTSWQLPLLKMILKMTDIIPHEHLFTSDMLTSLCFIIEDSMDNKKTQMLGHVVLSIVSSWLCNSHCQPSLLNHLDMVSNSILNISEKMNSSMLFIQSNFKPKDWDLVKNLHISMQYLTENYLEKFLKFNINNQESATLALFIHRFIVSYMMLVCNVKDWGAFLNFLSAIDKFTEFLTSLQNSNKNDQLKLSCFLSVTQGFPSQLLNKILKDILYPLEDENVWTEIASSTSCQFNTLTDFKKEILKHFKSLTQNLTGLYLDEVVSIVNKLIEQTHFQWQEVPSFLEKHGNNYQNTIVCLTPLLISLVQVSRFKEQIACYLHGMDSDLCKFSSFIVDCVEKDVAYYQLLLSISEGNQNSKKTDILSHAISACSQSLIAWVQIFDRMVETQNASSWILQVIQSITENAFKFSTKRIHVVSTDAANMILSIVKSSKCIYEANFNAIKYVFDASPRYLRSMVENKMVEYSDILSIWYETIFVYFVKSNKKSINAGGEAFIHEILPFIQDFQFIYLSIFQSENFELTVKVQILKIFQRIIFAFECVPAKLKNSLDPILVPHFSIQFHQLQGDISYGLAVEWITTVSVFIKIFSCCNDFGAISNLYLSIEIFVTRMFKDDCKMKFKSHEKENLLVKYLDLLNILISGNSKISKTYLPQILHVLFSVILPILNKVNCDILKAWVEVIESILKFHYNSIVRNKDQNLGTQNNSLNSDNLMETILEAFYYIITDSNSYEGILILLKCFEEKIPIKNILYKNLFSFSLIRNRMIDVLWKIVNDSMFEIIHEDVTLMIYHIASQSFDINDQTISLSNFYRHLFENNLASDVKECETANQQTLISLIDTSKHDELGFKENIRKVSSYMRFIRSRREYLQSFI